MYPDIKLRLPGWVVEFCESWEGSFGNVEGRARFVVELARQNVERDCGGPFAAAVFDLERESLVAPVLIWWCRQAVRWRMPRWWR